MGSNHNPGNGEVARQEGRRRPMVVMVLLQRIGTGRGRAEFPMQVQGVRPKAVHQDGHASGRVMVAAEQQPTWP